MLQRFKGALDARIAEEQAKQRASAQASRSRSGSTPKRSNSRNLSPSKRPLKGKDAESPGKALTGKGPDPSEFDPEFVIGEDDEQPSRTGTPRPKEKATDGSEAAGTTEDKRDEEDGKAEAADDKPTPTPELSPETKARLRKLDKLEPKYSGQCTCLAQHPVN